MNIIYSSASMRSKPTANSYLETECLFGEKLEVLDKFNEWFLCKLLTDNYCGWIKKEYLGYLKDPTHRVLSIRSYIFSQKNIKSNFIHYLSLGSKLHVKKKNVDWAEIYLSDKHNYKTAYVPSKHIVRINNKVKDWVTIAEQFINTPYKWGGRDSIGIDCSALIQLSCEAYGQNIPRNTKDQININKGIIKDLNKLERGYIVFWDGHVGVMVDKSNCLHANAFHMKTVIEPLNDIIERMGQKYKIIKIIDCLRIKP
jgi:hypothetical protein